MDRCDNENSKTFSELLKDLDDFRYLLDDAVKKQDQLLIVDLYEKIIAACDRIDLLLDLKKSK